MQQMFPLDQTQTLLLVDCWSSFSFKSGLKAAGGCKRALGDKSGKFK